MATDDDDREEESETPGEEESGRHDEVRLGSGDLGEE